MNNVILKDLDALLITSPSNLLYISGYDNADAMILLTPKHKYYFTDARALEEVKELLISFKCIDANPSEYLQLINAILIDSNIKTLGYEDDYVTHRLFGEFLEEFKSIKLTASSSLLTNARMIKSEDELIKIKRSQEITDQSFAELLPNIKDGMTERELASILEMLLFKNGADSLAFSSIVAFGANTAKPHAHRSQNKLKSGDFITLDFGARVNGYCSDMTRTIAFGTPSKEMIKIYNMVLTAQEIALDNITAGISTIVADAFSRNYFKKFEMANYFCHSLGHSLGIDIHEPPRLSSKLDSILQPNMVVSVEPGLYLPDKFGVRIEDIIIIKKTEVENLTKSVKKLIII